MFTLGSSLSLIIILKKGRFFRAYGASYLIFFLWASLFGFRGVFRGQVFIEDYINHGFLLLSLWLGLLVFITEFRGSLKFQFCNFVFRVCGLCSLCFIMGNGILYFLFFELVFVPISALVLIWGYNKERIRAVVYIVVYSFLGGGFHLISLVSLLEGSGSLFLVGRVDGGGEIIEIFMWWLGLMILFLVKAPLFIFHLWLPKAHVEAPTCASILLAGLLLKLGTYGLFLYEGVWQASSSWRSIWQVLGLWGGIHAAVLCMRELNLKKIVALSSVRHISIRITSFFVCTRGGWDAIYIIGIIHGLCSSGIFSWVGCHYYHAANQNRLLAGGYRRVGVLARVSLVFLSLGVAGIPPMGSFWGEFFMFSVFLNRFITGGVVLVLVGILNLLFICYLRLWVCHGEWGRSRSKVFWGGTRRYLCMFGHWLPCVFLFIFLFLVYF